MLITCLSRVYKEEIDLYQPPSAGSQAVLLIWIPTTPTRYCQVSAPSKIENISRAEVGTTPHQVTVKVLAKQLCIFTSAWVGTLISVQSLASLICMAEGRFKDMWIRGSHYINKDAARDK